MAPPIRPRGLVDNRLPRRKRARALVPRSAPLRR